MGLLHFHGEGYITFGADRESTLDESVGIGNFNGNIVFRTGDGMVQVPFDPKKDRGRWVHYAMTFDNGKLRAYRDGEPVGQASTKVAITVQRAALARHWWASGRSSSTRFQGYMDNVRVYDRVLSQGQLKRLANEE